jgi:indole-3-glycerol phosphate synthase
MVLMLDRIVADVRRTLPDLHRREVEIRAAAETAAPARDFRRALATDGLSVIAEIKRASPSRGMLNEHLDPAGQAMAYEDGGAAAISVLTEPRYFMGSPADLRAVKAAVGLPVLRKDFTVDAVQIWEARAMGADAILLIVAVLDPIQLRELLAVADEAGVAALVEVHSADEAEEAIDAGAEIMGVNNRDLTTFEVDIATAEAIAPLIAEAPIRVAESGIHGPDDAARMRAAGYHALLVGESLVRSEHPASAIQALRTAET